MMHLQTIFLTTLMGISLVFGAPAPCGDCKPVGFCGDGHVNSELGEICDLGKDKNGKPGQKCTADCKPCGVCGDGIIDAGEACDDGPQNGKNGKCSSTCTKIETSTPDTSTQDTSVCQTCDPNPFFNKCTVTTSCISTPSKKLYCACRAGYRATGLAPTDAKQFRLNYPGQLYRVFVAPGVECNTLCTTPHPGPDSCKEVPVKSTC